MASLVRPSRATQRSACAGAFRRRRQQNSWRAVDGDEVRESCGVGAHLSEAGRRPGLTAPRHVLPHRPRGARSSRRRSSASTSAICPDSPSSSPSAPVSLNPGGAGGPGRGGDHRRKELTPDEQVREGAEQARQAVVAELLDHVQSASPAFFEELVVELLVSMGYGGSHADAAAFVGRSGDGGIDGIIKEDRLGLESIYIQAKRWRGELHGRATGHPAVRGSTAGSSGAQGVFITTARFSADAIEYARTLQTTIVLIDGRQLADYMIDYEVGVNVQKTVKLYKVDEDYFSGGLTGGRTHALTHPRLGRPPSRVASLDGSCRPCPSPPPEAGPEREDALAVCLSTGSCPVRVSWVL